MLNRFVLLYHVQYHLLIVTNSIAKLEQLQQQEIVAIIMEPAECCAPVVVTQKIVKTSTCAWIFQT